MKKEVSIKEIPELTECFQNGKIVAFPTDTVYGIGVRFGDVQLLDRLKKVKNRTETKPVPVMVDSLQMAERLVEIDERAACIFDQLLPGPLTLILKKKKEIDPRLSNGLETLAIRIPDHPELLRVISGLGQPIFATSANLSGQPEALDSRDLEDMDLDLDIIAVGECARKQASTIVDLSKDQISILRQGPISLSKIQEILEEAGLSDKKL